MPNQEALNCAKELLSFINEAPTAGHAVQASINILAANGFKEISEKDNFNLNCGDKFYIVRHQTSLIAGIMGESVEQNGFKIIGSHTDSPGFKLKASALGNNCGYLTLSCEVYGGPIYSSWQDREVSLAGRVVVKNGNSYEIHLVDLTELTFAMPQVSIHYNRDANSASSINPQTQLIPLLGQSDSVNSNLLTEMIATKLAVSSDEIISFDLHIYAKQAGTIGGLNQEFIYSPRIDNLSMVQASLKALIESTPTKSTQMVALFDNEEVGSSTTNGGNSSFLQDVLMRIAGKQSIENYYRAISQSFFISADGAHAVHPGYQEKFDGQNRVYMNKGPAIKINANTGYASTVESIGAFEMVCQKAEIPYQKFVNRADIRGGGTIGTMIATNLGMLTVDIGNPLLAMHSARECAGVYDHFYMIKALKTFLN